MSKKARAMAHVSSAEDMLGMGDPTAAIAEADLALKLDLRCAAALEVKAMALLELDRAEEAHPLLIQAAHIEPNDGPAKYMYLGQLSSGHEAVQYIRKGIQIMEKALKAMKKDRRCSPDDRMDAAREISAAYCALTEVYLTELCDEADAQAHCVSAMQTALKLDPSNVQALQTMASIHISMEKPDEARDYMRRSLAQWFIADDKDEQDEKSDDDDDNDKVDQKQSNAPAATVMSTKEEKKGKSKANANADESMEDDWEDCDDNGNTEQNGEQEEEGKDDDDNGDIENEDDDDENKPSYEFRVNTAKILLELSMHTEAITILERLIVEDDEVMVVWYLLGWANHLANDTTGASEALAQAKVLYTKFECDQPDILEHIEELVRTLPSVPEGGEGGGEGENMQE